MHADDQSGRIVARLALLSKVGALAGTLDYEKVLSAVARLSIPELADWCIVDVVEEGQARRMEVAHRDPARAPLAAALRGFPLDHAARRRLPVAQALQSRQPVLIADYTEDMLLVRQVVSAHGGSITVDSTAERGTTFTVRLPRSRLAEARGTRRDEGAAAAP